ncbi:MAG: TAT-variant-translocated molybdopterin oxidoreductase [Verrucomicrobia bacterium]|nr:TAT-variant-translocated molybdopterin oxidoreductase [Verrucomicrobiota bacterium]
MSKRIWQHPDIPASEQGTEVWRSVGELENTPQFRTWMEREFPAGTAEMDEEEREMSRRNFVKLMGASSALAGLTLASCRRPEAYIVPYKQGPEWIIPGKPLFYATSMPRSEGAVPLVVTTHEGRPTKLEPNRTHPNGGGTDAFTQASVLDLYAPSRSRDILKNGEEASREEFVAAMTEVAKGSGKIGFVFGEDDSPTRARMVGELGTAFSEAKFYRYEPLAGEGRKKALDGAFGADGAEVVADFSKAQRILSLDADFASLDQQGEVGPFFKGRQGGGDDYSHEVAADKMNRLYVVETAFSMTGGLADHRLRATPSEIFRFAAEIAIRVNLKAQDAQLQKILADIDPLVYEKSAERDDTWKREWINACAEDLWDNKGQAMVLAGRRHSEGLHRLVTSLNFALEAYGDNKPLRPVKTGREGLGSIEALATDLESGAVETLILLTPANPVYDAPSDLRFGELLKKAKNSVHLGLRTDATAWASTWHVPAAHYLESWSDSRTAQGTYCLVQPMILPLFGGLSELELLSQLLAWKEAKAEEAAPALITGEDAEGGPSPAYLEVRKTVAAIAGEGEDAWKEALKNGFVADSAYKTIDLGAGIRLDEEKTAAAVAAALFLTPALIENLELSFATDGSVYDGRYIDNGWLQEAPDPISKICWDNAALVSPRTAKALGVYEQITQLQPESKIFGVENGPKPEIGEGRDANAPFITIKVGAQTLEIPVVVAFGHADNCITVSLGYGQGATDGRQGAPKLDKDKPTVGLVGRNTGFNAYPLRTSATSLFVTGVTTAGAGGKRYPMAFTQEHHAMYGRALAREISTNDVKHKSFEEQLANVRKQGMDSHAPDNISLYLPKGSSNFQKDEAKVENLISDKIHQWGMTIDLNTCMGCNACLVACQAENNIPIVGKEQVAMGREMHWIRMDRYFAAPKFERDGHGHVKKEKIDGKEVEKVAPEWVRDNPELIPQPVACVQCEAAPCETVCPVNATVHTEEGLNTMAYNRCIGTRYCANNCPYKARRFNFFDYNKRNPLIDHNLYKGPAGKKQVGEAPHLQRNPNVSVRMRGVMEKCTYCVQRLEGAKIKRKQVQRSKSLAAAGGSKSVDVSVEDLRVKTDSVKTACQDACPAEAISFGNLLDTNSRVFRAKYFNEKENGSWKPKPRNYDLLNYVGTIPRTSYLARVKNPNEKMPDAKYAGQATIHMT